MWEKIKAFLNTKIVKIIVWVLLFASITALVVVGVSSGDVTQGIGLIAAIIAAVTAFVAFIIDKTKTSKSKVKRIIAGVAWTVLFICVLALIIAGVSTAVISDATGLAMAAIIAAGSAFVAFIIAVTAFVAFIIDKTKTNKSKVKRIIAGVAWTVLFICVLALIIAGVSTAVISDATGLAMAAIIAAGSAFVAFIIDKTKTSKK